MGIDPGTRTTGYGVIRNGKAIDFGCIRPPADLPLSKKYMVIHLGVKELIQKYHPKSLVIETQYVKCNVQSALKLGMARGAAIAAAAGRDDVEVFEYAPSVAKMAVTGTGRASKHQVQMMMQNLLGLSAPPSPEDAADALALALCHYQRSGSCIAR